MLAQSYTLVGDTIKMNSRRKVTLCRALLLILTAVPFVPAWAQTELILNGGFESGSTGWVLSGAPFLAEVAADGGLARSGMYYLWLGGAVSDADVAYQTITIPSTAISCTLSFYYNITSQEGDPVVYDTFSATIRSTSG